MSLHLRKYHTLSLITLLSFVSCFEPNIAKPEPEPNGTADVLLPVNINRNIDLLFVIDDSKSMRAEQTALKENFSKFMELLESIPGGKPNLHIAITTTGVAGTHTCEDAPSGQFQFGIGAGADPMECIGKTLNAGTFIVDTEVPQSDPPERNKNYNAELEEVFGCMAQVGTDGCGFEQPLEAARLALSNNPGFIRPNALLAVVFLTDEDDCSAADHEIFFDVKSSLDNHRCFEYGVKCSPDTPRTPGEKALCESRESSPFLTPIDEYVQYFKSFKPDPRSVIIAGIMGEPVDLITGESFVEVVNAVDDKNVPGHDLEKICHTEGEPNSGADPAVRMKQFLDNFQNRNTFESICEQDLTGGLSKIAELLALAAGSPCLRGELADLDPSTPEIDPECVVEFQPDGINAEPKLVPPCSTDNPDTSEMPCWYTKNDTSCQSETNIKMIIARPSGGQNLRGDDRVQCRRANN